MLAGNGKNHPPMAAQNVGSPRPAAAGFEQRLASLAEFVQIRVTRNDDFSPRFNGRTRVPRHDLPNEVSARRIIGRLLRRIELGVKKEFPSRACQDETAMAVGWRRITFGRAGFFSVLEVVDPIGLVLKGKGIAAEHEFAPFRWMRSFQHKQLACAAS